MDIISLNKKALDKSEKVGNTITNYLRYRDIKNYYKGLNDVIEVQKQFPKVNYRYFIIPQEDLASGIH